MAESQIDALGAWDIVVVTFNSANALQEVWSTVPECVRDRVICVDNSSTDHTVDVARALFPKVLSSPNRGLSVANNLGASAGSSPYVLFANPDLAPRAEDFALLSEHLDTHRGLVSPRLVGDDGTLQENARGWPVLASQISNRVKKSQARSYRWPLAPSEDGPVPWILGASVAVRRDDLQEIGGWPEEYFLYYEDVVLCMLARAAGMPVWLLGSMEWRHQWARASRSYLSRSTRLHAQSAARFFLSFPGFAFRVPRRFRAQLSRERSEVARGRSWGAVDLIVRSDADVKHGGDVVQAEQSCLELTRIGVDARIVPFRLGYSPRPGAIVHMFNIDRPWEFLYLSKRVEAERLVVSPIHHSHSLTQQMRKSEARGWGPEALAARLPMRFREAVLFALRCNSEHEVSRLLRIFVALWALVQSVVSRPSTVGRSLERCRKVCLLSQRELGDLRRDVGYEGENYVLVPNGLESIAERGLEWSERAERILVVGRIEPRKRQVEIADVANRLGISITFVGAANGKRDDYVSRFRKALEKGSSEWLGQLPHSEVLDLMGRSRVLVNLSWLEVQSLVDLEGAAAGCSLVVSAAGATKEWLGEVVAEYPVGPLAEALAFAQHRTLDTEKPAPFSYPHTWRTAAEKLAQIYIGA